MTTGADSDQTFSIVMAAGRGSRMKDYEGNKTLLPLVPEGCWHEGRQPMIRHILANLPAGPKGIIIHHCGGDVREACGPLALYCEQPELNGTGGAILAARELLRNTECPKVIITMGDVPFTRPETYDRLAAGLAGNHLMVLGFQPADRKRYGVLDIKEGQVNRIVEWKDWHKFPAEEQDRLTVCNSGIYAARREELLEYLDILASKPHRVEKEIGGQWVTIEEYFLTDIVEFMQEGGLSVGHLVAADEMETMGVDDPEALALAQRIYGERYCEL